MADQAATMQVDRLQIEVFPTRAEMGAAAAAAAAAYLRDLLQQDSARRVRMLFAAAPSQNEFLTGLTSAPGIDWSRVDALHLDEYIGLPEDAPQSFARFVRERVIDKVHPGSVEYLNGRAPDPEAECRRYAALLSAAPVDILCAGIGENGHLAFNDPPVADFDDPKLVKIVDLDAVCRQQQVNDGAFAALDQVPHRAMTLTIPALMSAERVFCIVPGPTKTDAVYHTVRGPITTECPASILRRHPNATLYLDRASAARITS